MAKPAALIADNNIIRAAQLQEQLEAADFECAYVSSVAEIANVPRALFIAGDDPVTSCSDEFITEFSQRFPQTPVVVLTDGPLWEVITLAVKNGAWMDIPKSNKYDNLLTRYTSSRSPRPTVIIEENPLVCEKLLGEWHDSPHYKADLLLVHDVGNALQAVVDGRVPVLLNQSPPPQTRHRSDISTLIYSFCPAVIAAIIEAYYVQPKNQNFIQTEPVSQFAVLKPPFRSSELKKLLTSMDVVWPVTSPL